MRNGVWIGLQLYILQQAGLNGIRYMDVYVFYCTLSYQIDIKNLSYNASSSYFFG